jgi:hypothetical protein
LAGWALDQSKERLRKDKDEEAFNIKKKRRERTREKLFRK